MDQEMIKYIADFLSKFYIWEILIILIAIALTGILKLPIKKHALKLQEKYGVDKSMLTWITALFPYILCLLMVFALFWYKAGFPESLESLDFSGIITEGLLLGSGAIGLYEAVKKIVKGSKAIKEKKVLQKDRSLAKQPIKIEYKKSKYRIDD